LTSITTMSAIDENRRELTIVFLLPGINALLSAGSFFYYVLDEAPAQENEEHSCQNEQHRKRSYFGRYRPFDCRVQVNRQRRRSGARNEECYNKVFEAQCKCCQEAGDNSRHRYWKQDPEQHIAFVGAQVLCSLNNRKVEFLKPCLHHQQNKRQCEGHMRRKHCEQSELNFQYAKEPEHADTQNYLRQDERHKAYCAYVGLELEAVPGETYAT